MSHFHANKLWPYGVSAGGVLIKHEADKVLYALLERNNDKHFRWHLPKGSVENNESLETAALREVAEEAGVSSKIISYLGARTDNIPPEIYGYSIELTKHYFLMQFISETEAGMDSEHDGISWFEYPDALKRISNSPKGEDDFLKRADTWLKNH